MHIITLYEICCLCEIKADKLVKLREIVIDTLCIDDLIDNIREIVRDTLYIDDLIDNIETKLLKGSC